jgi:hypothetical protein
LGDPSQQIGLNIVESFFNTGESVSRIEISDKSFTSAEGLMRLCPQLDLAPCDDSVSTSGMNASILLPPCTTEIKSWCVEGLSIYKKEGINVNGPATLIRSVAGPTYAKNDKYGLPQTGNVSLWRAEGQINSGGANTYAVYAYVLGSRNVGGKFSFHDLRAMVLPYSIKNGAYSNGTVSEHVAPSGKTRIGISGGVQECAWTETGTCGLIEDFPTDARAKLSLRVGNSLTGWLMGRVTNPNIEVTPISETQNQLIVDSEPAIVPKFYIATAKTNATPEISKIDPAIRDGHASIHNQLASETQFELADAWAKFDDDKSAGLISTWSLTTTTTGVGSSCLSDNSKLLGFVSTNASIYEGRAPSFVNNSLNYKVWSQHYNPDGSEFKGKYDLLLRSETARCLYGFSNAPVSAEISITSSNGVQQVSTTTLTENAGWLHLSASGFTFSSPTIAVKFAQSNSDGTSTPIAKSSQTGTSTESAKATSKKKTIFCVKLNKTVKITGVAPKCPAGYKTKN